jgi:Glycine zipper
MTKHLIAVSVLVASAIGCENLPGTRESQGAVIGGTVGAAAGAAVNDENRLLGALIGGALGAGGGYLIGARTDWFDDPERDREAREAIRDAQTSPATVDDVRQSLTADLNGDGFVTTDELVAMEEAGLSDAEIIRRLRDTGQIYELSASQEEALLRAGVSRRVIAEMQTINRSQREEVLGRRAPR